jgi:hypothetical protein
MMRRSLLHLYRLTNDQLARWLGFLPLVCGGMFILSLLLTRTEVKGYYAYSVHRRFEDLYMVAGCVWVYALAVASVIGFFIYTIYADYWGNKAIYTYMTLPTRREWVYVSRIIACILGLLAVTAVQVIAVQVSYAIYADHISGYEEGRYLMNNGMFLAFIRSTFLRLIMPLGWLGTLCSTSMLLALVTGLYHAILCERAKRRIGHVFNLAAAWVWVDLCLIVLQQDAASHVMERMIAESTALLLLIVYFVWHSVYLIRRGAIA